jgi:hypothetical protein
MGDEYDFLNNLLFQVSGTGRDSDLQEMVVQVVEGSTVQ